MSCLDWNCTDNITIDFVSLALSKVSSISELPFDLYCFNFVKLILNTLFHLAQFDADILKINNITTKISNYLYGV